MKKWMVAFPSGRQFVMACLLAFVVLSAIVTVKAVISSDNDAHSICLSVSLKSPGDGVASLYYDVGKGFNENHVVSVSIRGGAQFDEYLFKMPNKTIYNLRWDPPLLTHDVISVKKMEILDGSRKSIKRLSLNQLEPLHQIGTFALSDAKADFQVQEGANDPQIKIRLESPLSVKRLSSLFLFVGGVFLEFLGLFLSACLLIIIWFHQKDKVIATVIVIILVVFGWHCWVLYDEAEYLFLQVSMSSSVDSTAQVYYDLGQGLNENNSVRMYVTGTESIRDYRFKLPNKLIYGLRFDPLTTGGRVKIGDILVTDVFGKVFQRLDWRQLKPGNQIQSLIFLAKEAEITVPEKANDPQLAVPLKEPLDFVGKLPFPLWRGLLKIITGGILFILFTALFILVWKKWDGICLASLDSSFVQEKLPLIYLGTAFGLILAMGFISGLDVHPDEWNGHIKAAGYYLHNWLPPAVDDPRVEKTLSVFGFSYLFYNDVIYFLAVKATLFLSGIVTDFYLRLRLANAFLFLLLIITLTLKIKRVQWTVLFLIMTPQLWYIFSYFNNDVFPWCISMLLAWQVVDPDSSLNRFLVGADIRTNLGKGVFVGILIGLLLMSKLNYWIYIGYIGCIGLWGILFDSAADHRFVLLKKWIFIGCVALAVYLPFYGYNQYVNDFNKSEKIMIVIEKFAAPQFKPSTLMKDLSSSYKGLRLRDKGHSFQEVFIQNPDWRDLSFKSFFGLYGYMQFLSDSDYYQAVIYTLGAFFILVFIYVAFTLPTKDILFFLFVLFFVILTLGLSTYHSWVNDYQPQGRYLFPILPILMIGLAKLPASFRTRIMPPFCLIFFTLSVWSFLLTGLKIIPKIN